MGLDAGTRGRVRLDNVQTLASHHKAPKTGLVVTLPSGKVINHPVAADTFALALQEIGLDRVRKLGKRVASFPLICDQQHEEYSQRQFGSVFVMTQSSTQAKKDMLEEIANELGVSDTVSGCTERKCGGMPYPSPSIERGGAIPTPCSVDPASIPPFGESFKAPLSESRAQRSLRDSG